MRLAATGRVRGGIIIDVHEVVSLRLLAMCHTSFLFLALERMCSECAITYCFDYSYLPRLVQLSLIEAVQYLVD